MQQQQLTKARSFSFGSQQLQQREDDVTVTAEAESAEKYFHTNCSKITAAFVGFDSEERLVLWRNVDRVYSGGMVKLFVEGTTLEEVLRGMAAKQAHVRSGATAENWVRGQLDAYRHPSTTGVDTWLPDGRWVRVTVGRTSDGGLVSFHADVTQSKAELRQRRLARRPQRIGVLHDARKMQEPVLFESDSPLCNSTEFSVGASIEHPPSLLMRMAAEQEHLESPRPSQSNSESSENEMGAVRIEENILQLKSHLAPVPRHRMLHTSTSSSRRSKQRSADSLLRKSGIFSWERRKRQIERIAFYAARADSCITVVQDDLSIAIRGMESESML